MGQTEAPYYDRPIFNRSISNPVRGNMNRKWVVRISLEGWLCSCWLKKERPFHETYLWTTTESLDSAEEFDSVQDAHIAVSEWGLTDRTWVLGYEIIFKGLSYPNP